MKQFKCQILPPKDIEYPIWLWKCWYGKKRARPNLRSGGHIFKGEKGVRLELEIPDEKILLSDFDGWHMVLNNMYYPCDDEDDELFEGFALNEKNPEIIQQRKEEREKKNINTQNIQTFITDHDKWTLEYSLLCFSNSKKVFLKQ